MSYVTKSLFWTICLSIASTPSVMAEGGPDDPGRSFSIAHDPEFQHAPEVMARLVRSHGLKKVGNVFCVVGYNKSSEKIAWVYWSNQKSLILWEPQERPVADLSRSRRQLDLRRDVVSDEASLRGSSYRVTQSWVDRVIDDCEAVGLKIKFSAK